MNTYICTYNDSLKFVGNVQLLQNNYIQANCDGFYKYNFNDVKDLLEENPIFFKRDGLLSKSNLWLPYILLKTMDKINDGSAVNLSTGKLTSFIDFAKKTCNILGFNPKVEGTESKPEGVFARGGDVTKQNKLGFQYSTELDDGIKKALMFFEKNL